MQYITAARNQRDRVEGSKELRKLVFFSNICVAPLLEDLKARRGGAGGHAALRCAVLRWAALGGQLYMHGSIALPAAGRP